MLVYFVRPSGWCNVICVVIGEVDGDAAEVQTGDDVECLHGRVKPHHNWFKNKNLGIFSLILFEQQLDPASGDARRSQFICITFKSLSETLVIRVYSFHDFLKCLCLNFVVIVLCFYNLGTNKVLKHKCILCVLCHITDRRQLGSSG